jgi:DNA polymerase III alpha subunit
MYFPLTTHSAYSLQEGLLTPADLVQAAKTSGMQAIGLTDHHLLTGVIEFVTACKQTGIQPIIGLEIDLESGPLNLLATSLEGWSRLCRLSSALALRNEPEAPCTLEMLSAHSSDLIALGSHPESLIDIFPGRLYIPLKDPASAAALSDRAKQYALPTVVTHPVYYLHPGQSALQRTLTAIRLNKNVDQLPEGSSAPLDSYFMSSQEVESRFAEFPEALDATMEIAGRCNFDLPIGRPQMPVVPLPAGITA